MTSYAELVLGAARRTTSPTRPSPSCSSRPNTLPRSARCWRRGGGERLPSRRFGPRTWSSRRAIGDPQVETDRARFIGRGRDLRDPAAMDKDAAVRHRWHRARPGVRHSPPDYGSPPGAMARVAFWTMVAPSAGCDLDLRRPASGRYRPSTVRPRWPGPRRRCSCATSASTPAEADLFQRLAGHLLFAGPALRPDRETHSARRRRRNRACGRRAFPATCRSCCCASTTSTDLGVVRQVCWRHTNIGG